MVKVVFLNVSFIKSTENNLSYWETKCSFSYHNWYAALSSFDWLPEVTVKYALWFNFERNISKRLVYAIYSQLCMTVVSLITPWFIWREWLSYDCIRNKLIQFWSNCLFILKSFFGSWGFILASVSDLQYVNFWWLTLDN